MKPLNIETGIAQGWEIFAAQLETFA